MMTMMVALVLTAGSVQERTFTVPQPYQKSIDRLQKEMESMDQDKPQPGLTIHKFDFTDDKQVRRKTLFASHLTIVNRMGRMELWGQGSFQELEHCVIFHAYTTQMQGQVAYMRIWGIMSAKTASTTQIQLHTEVQVRTPTLYRRSGRPRVAVNWALRTPRGQAAISGVVGDMLQAGLQQAEGQLKKTLLSPMPKH